MKRDFFTFLVYARTLPVAGRLAYYALKMFGVEIPLPVQIGKDFELAHGGFGVVIHPKTVIGDGVKMYPGVTLGRADIFRPASQSGFAGIEIGDGAILSPGAKVLGKNGILRVGKGTVLGANAVLLCSTGEDEIWAGVPAKCVRKRSQEEKSPATGRGYASIDRR
ncbi:MAG TPA: hypothetical protein VE131_13540 [Terriglobales bacterium]|nr:hypothetical protein [Terriglobales bacterium]